MDAYRTEFIDLARQCEVLKFGEFTLKSSRLSPYFFNAGGTLVGNPLHGRVLVIDDVITAGTAVRQVIDIIAREGAELAGVVVGLDRQERGAGALSAIQEVEQEHGVPVLSIVNMGHIIDYLDSIENVPSGALNAMRRYRESFGV